MGSTTRRKFERKGLTMKRRNAYRSQRMQVGEHLLMGISRQGKSGLTTGNPDFLGWALFWEAFPLDPWHRAAPLVSPPSLRSVWRSRGLGVWGGDRGGVLGSQVARLRQRARLTLNDGILCMSASLRESRILSSNLHKSSVAVCMTQAIYTTPTEA